MSIIKTVQIEDNNKTLAAKLTYELRLQELEFAQKAVKEAEERLAKVAAEALKSMSLKCFEGEVIHVPEYKLTFCYHNNDYNMLPINV